MTIKNGEYISHKNYTLYITFYTESIVIFVASHCPYNIYINKLFLVTLNLRLSEGLEYDETILLSRAPVSWIV